MRMIADVADLRGCIERAASHIVCVFEADECGLRVVINFGSNDGFNFRPVENSIFASSDPRHATSNCRHGGEFVEVDVATFLANDFVAVMRPNFYGDEVPHASGWNEQGGFFAENLRGASFQGAYGRIFLINVIADFGFSH